MVYSGQARFVGIEEITVPFGSFDAVRVDSSQVLTLSSMVQSVSIVQTDTSWYVAGIGLVREVLTADGDTTISELVSTNVPEPRPSLLAAAALLAIAKRQVKRSTVSDGHAVRLALFFVGFALAAMVVSWITVESVVWICGVYVFVSLVALAFALPNAQRIEESKRKNKDRGGPDR